ncbi:hypothetical protein M758_11G097100 [Ceratodon purpureus]|nr:hypothetical protein M758_11G097100 [Ceratodon purpureus]
MSPVRTQEKPAVIPEKRHMTPLCYNRKPEYGITSDDIMGWKKDERKGENQRKSYGFMSDEQSRMGFAVMHESVVLLRLAHRCQATVCSLMSMSWLWVSHSRACVEDGSVDRSGVRCCVGDEEDGFLVVCCVKKEICSVLVRVLECGAEP